MKVSILVLECKDIENAPYHAPSVRVADRSVRYILLTPHGQA